jgi:SAM-dependent methyltransferase
MANMVLKDYSEVQDAINKIEKMALPMHNDKYKNWDIYHMLSFILKNGCDASSVLDMGCANYGVILPLLEKFGFKELYGCDLVIEKEINKGNIHYSRQDMQKTNYPDSFFDFITSISVIEHGVNIDRYLKETARLLKPGGYLLTTTDYWPDTIDTTGLYPYGELGEMKIFTQEEIELIFVKAAKYGLRLIKPMDFRCKNKVVHWERVDRRFTFIYFVLIKSDTN